MYGCNHFISKIWQHCIWHLWRITAKWIKQSFSLQIHMGSLLLMLWCCSFDYSRQVVYWRMAQDVEYSFNRLTDMILLCSEAECNSASAAFLYAERYPQWWHQNDRTFISLPCSLQKIGLMWPNMTNTGRPQIFRSTSVEEGVFCA
jgi:hypothetical protein